MRLVAHVDMDAFYASVELLRRPMLRGRAVVIGGRSVHHGASVPTLASYTGRGVVTTATYEARAFGVHSGMALMKAARLAPDALLLPADFDEYRLYSARFKAAVRALARDIEDRGIDEIYVDLTQLGRASDETGEPDWTHARELGARLQNAVHRATGLWCSIGIAANKLLAKIASDLDKPRGLTVLADADVPARIWPLDVRKINGIGPKTGSRLAALGIHTIGELAVAPPEELVRHFGQSYGAWLHDAALGRDERPVVTCREPKSISRETTFERDLHPSRDRERLARVFHELCFAVARDLERKKRVGRTIGLKLRYDNFRTLTRDCTLDRATRDADVIHRAAGECLKRVAFDRPIRLLGVRVSALIDPARAVNELAPDCDAIPSLFD